MRFKTSDSLEGIIAYFSINDNQSKLTSDFIALEDNMHNQIGDMLMYSFELK